MKARLYYLFAASVLVLGACGDETDDPVTGDIVPTPESTLVGTTESTPPGTVLPPGLAQTPAAPRDVASPPPETITPPPDLQLQTELEESVEGLRGSVTDLNFELDRLTVATGLEELPDAENVCQAVLDLEAASQVTEVEITGPGDAPLVECSR